jgi:hypothetical protein
MTQTILIFPVLMKISFSIHLANWNVVSSRSYTGLLFGILVIGICLSFEICYLEFPLTQLLREWMPPKSDKPEECLK